MRLTLLPSSFTSCARTALELRDGDKAKYMGKGVSKAVENVNTIIGPALVGMNPADQKAIGAPRGVTRLAPRIAR